jgi:hypothetical protein
MFRPTLTVLLIAALLASPIRCFVCQVSSGNGDVAQTASCGCCSQDGCESGSDASGPMPAGEPVPTGECDCQDCLCDGAISESDALPLAVKTIQVGVLPSTMISLDATRSVSSASRDWAQKVRPRYRCGRDARTAHQSWLI